MEEDLTESQSTVRGFKKHYKAKLKEASRNNVSPKKNLAKKMRGRPTLFGEKLDTLAQKFLRATRCKGGSRKYANSTSNR